MLFFLAEYNLGLSLHPTLPNIDSLAPPTTTQSATMTPKIQTLTIALKNLVSIPRPGEVFPADNDRRRSHRRSSTSVHGGNFGSSLAYDQKKSQTSSSAARLGSFAKTLFSIPR